MTNINPNYLDLQGDYLFAEINRRLRNYAETKPGRKIIRLGIGDVTQPLVPAVLVALRGAVAEQGEAQGFRGYGPEQGYAFLRETIVDTCYRDLGITPEDIFVGDGAKSDLGNFQELFAPDSLVAISDPVYPVYVDSNIMAGRLGSWQADGRFEKLIYLASTAENGFIPSPPNRRPDIIYLCSPNNPTGTVMSREQLALWVDYARKMKSVILFDAAYESFIRSPDIPRSIYEIEGAREVAVEFRSYSKSAGFTGLRCGFTVVPGALLVDRLGGDRIALRDMWLRRQTTKYNGCPYIVQRAAQAVHSEEGQRQTRLIIDGYLENAAYIREAFESLGLLVTGAVDAPYVWVRLPPGMGSWDFFDALLEKAHIVGTPGVGFGPCGEGCFRLTGFGDKQETLEAVERLKRFKL